MEGRVASVNASGLRCAGLGGSGFRMHARGRVSVVGFNETGNRKHVCSGDTRAQIRWYDIVKKYRAVAWAGSQLAQLSPSANLEAEGTGLVETAADGREPGVDLKGVHRLHMN